MAWPKYQPYARHAITGEHVKRFLADRQSLIAIGATVVIVFIYLLGLQFSLPIAHKDVIQKTIAQSTLLAAVNDLFTGGALGNASPFALGVLPLFFFYGGVVTLIGSRLRIQVQITRRAVFFVTLITALVVGWYMVIGAVPRNVLSFVVTFLYLVVGLWLLAQLETRLMRYGALDIISLNAVLIGVSYLRSLILSHSPLDLVAILFMGLFIFFLTRLMKEKRSVQLVNIRDEKLKDGTLSLPATTSYFQLSLLMVAFILVAVITTAINLFTNLHLSPFGHSPLDVLVLFLILAGVSVLFARNIFIDSLISQFNSTATASKLRLNYWIIPGKQTGLPTADHLTKQAIEIHSLTYIFYLAAVALFSLPELLAQLLHIPITHLPFGPLGFIIILTLSSQLGYALVDTVQRYIQRINSGNLWVLPHVTFSNLNLFLEPYDVAEFVLKLLPNATPEERVAFAQVLSSLTTGKTVLSDIQTAQRILREIAKRQAEEPLEMSFGQFLRRLLPCVILSLAFTVVVTWVIQLFYPQALTDLTVKEGLVFFFFGTFIALIPVVGLDQFVKSLFKRLHSGSPQRAVAAPELGTGQELDTFQSRLWYNEIVASQREVIDVERRNILAQSDIHQRVLTMLREEVHSLCEDSIPHDRTMTEEELETLLEKLDSWAPVPESLVPEDLAILTYDELEQKLTTFVLDSYEERHEAVKRLAKTWGKDGDPFLELERRYALQTLDRLWAKYLDELNSMYSNMRFRSLTQGDLVTEFRRDAQAMFEELQEAFRHTLTNTLLRSFHYSITGFPRPKSPRTLPSSEEYRALPQTVDGEDEHETDSQQNHSVPPE